MIKIRTRILAIMILCMITISITVFADNMVTLYSMDGRTISVHSNKVDAYKAVGWYDNYSDVVTVLYSHNGSATVYKAQVDSYLALGWSLTPVKIDSVSKLPMTFTNNSNRKIKLADFYFTNKYYHPKTEEIEMYYYIEAYDDTEYVKLKLSFFDSYGNFTYSEYIDNYNDTNYICVPANSAIMTISCDGNSYNQIFTYRKQVDLYSPNGDILTVYDIQAPVYTSVGWYECVDMYSLDGRSITVKPFDVEAYKSVGWYTEEGYAYAKTKEDYDIHMSRGDYISAMQTLDNIKYTVWNTEYEYPFSTLQSAAMDSWRNLIHCPLAVESSSVYKENYTWKTSITFRNLSYQPIIALKLHFDCYDVFGEKRDIGYTTYYADDTYISSGYTRTLVWDVDVSQKIHRADNFYITDVVFADGTIWGR